MPETVFLVCAPAEAALVVPGTIFGRQCSECRREVMIAPSGQNFLAEHPDAKILCQFCFRKLSGPVRTEFAASPAEFARERRAAVPNLWKYRN